MVGRACTRRGKGRRARCCLRTCQAGAAAFDGRALQLRQRWQGLGRCCNATHQAQQLCACAICHAADAVQTMSEVLRGLLKPEANPKRCNRELPLATWRCRSASSPDRAVVRTFGQLASKRRHGGALVLEVDVRLRHLVGLQLPDSGVIRAGCSQAVTALKDLGPSTISWSLWLAGYHSSTLCPALTLEVIASRSGVRPPAASSLLNSSR